MASRKRPPENLDESSSSGHIGHLVVGDEPCTFVQVRDVLYGCASAGKLWLKLIDVAISLEIPTDCITSLEMRIKNGMITYPGALIEILEAWRRVFTAEAKLKNLINALDLNGLADCAEALRIRFNYDVDEVSRLKSKFTLKPLENLAEHSRHKMISKHVIMPEGTTTSNNEESSRETGDNEHFIVGDEPCAYVEVRDALTRCENVNKLWPKLIEVAKSLKIPDDTVIALKLRIPTKMVTYPDALIEILEAWRGKFSSEATLQMFINVLETNGLTDCADALRTHFNEFDDAYVVSTIQNLMSTYKSSTWKNLPDHLKLWMNSKPVKFQGNKKKLEELTAQKGGRLKLAFIENPWQLWSLQKIKNEIHDATDVSDVFMDIAEKSGILTYQEKENIQSEEEKVKGQRFYEVCQNKNGSFERICMTLLFTNQTRAYTILTNGLYLPIENIHQKYIMSKLIELRECTTVSFSLMGPLLEAGAFSITQIDEIRNTEGNLEKCEKFYTMIASRDCYKILISALEKSRNVHAAAILRNLLIEEHEFIEQIEQFQITEEQCQNDQISIRKLSVRKKSFPQIKFIHEPNWLSEFYFGKDNMVLLSENVYISLDRVQNCNLSGSYFCIGLPPTHIPQDLKLLFAVVTEVKELETVTLGNSTKIMWITNTDRIVCRLKEKGVIQVHQEVLHETLKIREMHSDTKDILKTYFQAQGRTLKIDPDDQILDKISSTELFALIAASESKKHVELFHHVPDLKISYELLFKPKTILNQDILMPKSNTKEITPHNSHSVLLVKLDGRLINSFKTTLKKLLYSDISWDDAYNIHADIVILDGEESIQDQFEELKKKTNRPMNLLIWRRNRLQLIESTGGLDYIRNFINVSVLPLHFRQFYESIGCRRHVLLHLKTIEHAKLEQVVHNLAKELSNHTNNVILISKNLDSDSKLDRVFEGFSNSEIGIEVLRKYAAQCTPTIDLVIAGRSQIHDDLIQELKKTTGVRVWIVVGEGIEVLEDEFKVLGTEIIPFSSESASDKMPGDGVSHSISKKHKAENVYNESQHTICDKSTEIHEVMETEVVKELQTIEEKTEDNLLKPEGGVVNPRLSANPWRLEHLRKNIDAIIQATELNSELINKAKQFELLTEHEMQKVKAEPKSTQELKESRRKLECKRFYARMFKKKGSYERLCMALVSCKQVHVFVMLRQYLYAAEFGSIVFITPPTDVMRFINSQRDYVMVICSHNIDLSIMRIRNSIDSQVKVIEEHDLKFENSNVKLAVVKCRLLEDELMKKFTREETECKVIWICSQVSKDLEKSYVTDIFTWADISNSIIKRKRFIVGDHEYNANELLRTPTSLQMLFEKDVFRGDEIRIIAFKVGHKAKDETNYLSTDIFHYHLYDKIVFLGISTEKLHGYSKFGHKIGTFNEIVDKLDYVIIHQVEQFENVCKSTTQNVHLIEYSFGVFKVIKTWGSNQHIREFITKINLCEDFPACNCDAETQDLMVEFTFQNRKHVSFNCFVNVEDILPILQKHLELDISIQLFQLTSLLKIISQQPSSSLMTMKHPIGELSSKSHTDQIIYVINELLKRLQPEDREQSILKHVAVNTLFPKFVKSTQLIGLEKFVQAGLVRAESSEFVHEFAAWYFIALLMVGNDTPEYIDLRMLRKEGLLEALGSKKVHVTFRWWDFFKYRSKEMESFEWTHNRVFDFIESLLICSNKDSLKNHLEEIATPELMVKCIHACVVGSHANLLEMMINVGKHGKLFESEELVVIAVKYANENVINIVVEQYMDETEKNITNIRFELKHDDEVHIMSVLHVAALRGDHGIVRYLLYEVGFMETLNHQDMKNILHHCVIDTHAETNVNERIKIIELIIKTNPSLLMEKDKHECTPLLCPNIHVDLMLRLIQLGSNTSARDKKLRNLLHLSATYMSPAEYDKLVRCVQEEGNSKIFNVTDKARLSPLHLAVRNMEVKDSSLDLFSDFNSRATPRSNVLMSAVTAYRSSRLLDSLISRGAIVGNRGGKLNRTLLHMAIECANLTATKYLISKQNADVNAKDEEANTPLHLALKLDPFVIHELVQILLEHGANVNVHLYTETPLSIALTRKENDEIQTRTVNLLKKYGAR
ncbi:unnamed protein product [Orchesella dallaii]|uniref:Death domain-containing protein n=1 Tax=Orchesella dallaii TaxID=48710 RepID=A0ABP1RE99_9HEXA